MKGTQGLLRSILAVTLLVAALVPATAAAENPRLNVDTFRPSVHPGDILGVITANEPGHLKLGGGGFLTWNHLPLRFVNPSGDTDYTAVRDQFVADLFISLGLSKYLDLGLDIPIFLFTRGDNVASGYPFSKSQGASLGDIRLSLKGTILGGNGKGFGLGLAADLTLPSATPKYFNGDRLVSFKPVLFLDYSKKGWDVALNISYLVRANVNLGQKEIGDELGFALGLQIPFICSKLEGIVTVDARTMVTDFFKDKHTRSLDLMGGLKGRIGNVALLAAAGAGALQGYGSPAARVTLGVSYEPAIDKGCVQDTDGDGICDADDACPTEPGPAATKGCPDRDGDGITDKEDRCPDTAGLAALKGCPDRDGDGIADMDDQCPDQKGPVDLKGCPDRDKDGVADRDDQCPDTPGLPEFRGCPDTDKDGIQDKDDKCPTVPGKKEFQGCPPPETPKTVRVTDNKIEILQVVNFETNKAIIKPDSFGILNDVAQVLKDYPHLKKIQVEGHTDNVGKPAKNLKLSQDRAASVVTYLVNKGIDRDRLVPKGFGDTQPVADNKTPAGKAKNRRVEFLIVEK